MALAMPPPARRPASACCVKNVEVQRLDALADDEEQDERQRHQRDEHRQRAEADEQRRDELAATVSRLMPPPRPARRGRGARASVALRAMLQISSRDSALTISVMTNSTRPISMSACRYSSSAASVNSLAMHRRHRVLRREQRRRHLRVVADHHRHRHRLAERAAEAEHDRADDAGARVEERGADRLEPRRAERVGAPRAARSGTAFSTSRATDEVNGMTMIARISAADSMPTPSGGPLKSGSCRSARRQSRSRARAPPAPARRCPTARRRSTESPRAARSGRRAAAGAAPGTARR